MKQMMQRKEGWLILILKLLHDSMPIELIISQMNRFTGLIVGITDVDPVRWPGSKWRSLLV